MQWWCNDGGDDKYNDFLDGDDHNDYMMMSITLKVRVRPEDSGKQMICQVKKTKHENLHIYSFFVPIIFWFVYIMFRRRPEVLKEASQPSGTSQCIVRIGDLIGHNYQHHRNIHILVWWCDGALFLNFDSSEMSWFSSPSNSVLAWWCDRTQLPTSPSYSYWFDGVMAYFLLYLINLESHNFYILYWLAGVMEHF